MKRILLIISLLIACNNVWAFAPGTIPNPFIKASEAAAKIDSYFRDWLINEAPWVENVNKELKEKAYEEFVLKELIYTDNYTGYHDVLKNKENLLEDWSWVAVFIRNFDLTNTYTFVLKKDGTIVLIGTTD